MTQMALQPIKHTIHAADDPDYTKRIGLLHFAAATQDVLHVRAACQDGVTIDATYRVMQVDTEPVPEAICLLLPAVMVPGYPAIIAVTLAEISFVQHRKITAGHDVE
ncbi:MAG: hypothetical protein ACYDAR_09470 [Thermomicrobiales bacterium]